MKILVDADACPGRNIIEKAAMSHNIEVVMICDLNHSLQSDYSRIVYVDSGFQSVDMYLINLCGKKDIVVTQDFGVAAMALGKGAYAIGPKGYIYSEDNIDRLLFERHLSQKTRRAGGRTSSVKKRSSEDDDRLYKNLKLLIEKAINN
ncbi:YaiI/YqxD family protein [Clostridium polynesiense]|uniref:YaiI/YqxD family protein n=1 Tax=Clostridium polynesiense TaxID=1325933 RepID=UPI00058B070C|nr:YaiI/YqxD family protein [Clostridium polynesiense]